MNVTEALLIVLTYGAAFKDPLALASQLAHELHPPFAKVSVTAVAAVSPDTNPPSFVPVTVPAFAAGELPARCVVPFVSTPQLFADPDSIHAADPLPPNPTL
jgi:hypothetical protein